MQDLELDAFIYGKDFKALNLEISPIKLNTKKITSLYTNRDSRYFEGLAGVFFDSLPDSMV